MIWGIALYPFLISKLQASKLSKRVVAQKGRNEQQISSEFHPKMNRQKHFEIVFLVWIHFDMATEYWPSQIGWFHTSKYLRYAINIRDFAAGLIHAHDKFWGMKRPGPKVNPDLVVFQPFHPSQPHFFWEITAWTESILPPFFLKEIFIFSHLFP